MQTHCGRKLTLSYRVAPRLRLPYVGNLAVKSVVFATQAEAAEAILGVVAAEPHKMPKRFTFFAIFRDLIVKITKWRRPRLQGKVRRFLRSTLWLALLLSKLCQRQQMRPLDFPSGLEDLSLICGVRDSLIPSDILDSLGLEGDQLASFA